MSWCNVCNSDNCELTHYGVVNIQNYERLKAENARFRDALIHIQNEGPTMLECCRKAGRSADLTNHLIDIADEALKGQS